MPDAATATLKDVTAASSAAPDPSKSPASADTTTATTTATVEVADKDAVELGKLLLDSGVTKDHINDLLSAPGALGAIRHMVENDPQEFVRSIERTNPGAGQKFLDKIADMYIDRHASNDSDKDAGKDGKTNANAELEQQVRRLSEDLNGMRTASQQQAAQAAQAQVMARFNARVDDLFGQLPADKVPLSSYEKKIITGALKDELTSDPNVVKRIYNGNFVDVPIKFKSIVEGLVNDRKAAADTAKAARERSTSQAFPDFGSGPVELPKDFYDVSNVPLDKLWDEDQFVSALKS